MKEKNEEFMLPVDYEFNLSDFALFLSVMQVRKAYQSTLSIILDEKDLVMYTFTEQCEEVEGLHLEDGTTKIFLNMKSKNGRPELVSLLQYMKDTRLDNPEIIVQDERIKEIDAIVTEVKQSEEWEAVKMNILQIGEEHGKRIGEEIGRDTKLVELVCRKLRKGKTSEQIAEELEEELQVVEAICKAAESAAPEYDSEIVYKNWKE